MERLVVLTIIGCGLGLHGQPARATDTESLAAAQALFDQARTLVKNGEYASACPKLEESQRLDPGAGTLLHLGNCYEKVGKTASAWVTYLEAVSLAEATGRKEWGVLAKDRSKALEPKLSRLVIDVPAEARTEGLEVTRDGKVIERAQWEVPVPIDPGRYLIQASAPGVAPWSMPVLVEDASPKLHQISIPSLRSTTLASSGLGQGAGQSGTKRASVSTEGPPTEAGDSARDSFGIEGRSKGSRTAGYVFLGLGGVGIGLASVFGGLALAHDAKSKELCPELTCANAQAITENDAAKSSSLAAGVVGAVGVAAAVTGAVLLWRPLPTKLAPRPVALLPSVDTNGAGLSLRGRF